MNWVEVYKADTSLWNLSNISANLLRVANSIFSGIYQQEEDRGPQSLKISIPHHLAFFTAVMRGKREGWYKAHKWKAFQGFEIFGYYAHLLELRKAALCLCCALSLCCCFLAWDWTGKISQLLRY